MAKIKIEGQTIEMDDEIAGDDDLLKAALAPSWPDAKTATFTRTGGKDDKELVVSVTKKAGTKGMGDAEIEEQERFDRRKEEIALAADRFLRLYWKLDGDPACVGEDVDSLNTALEALGEDEIERIKSERRGA